MGEGSISKKAKHASQAGLRRRIVAIRDIGLRVVDVESGVCVQGTKSYPAFLSVSMQAMDAFALTTKDFFSTREDEP